MAAFKIEKNTDRTEGVGLHEKRQYRTSEKSEARVEPARAIGKTQIRLHKEPHLAA